MPDKPFKFPIPAYKRLLQGIENNDGINVARLAYSIDMTYSHVTKLLLAMKRAGLIKNGVEGRAHKLHITEKGKVVVDCLRKELEVLPKEMLE